MKYTLTLLSALFLTVLVHAQDDKRGYIGISAGSSIPFSDFASTDQDNDDAGYAINGGNLNISFGYRLGKNLGIAAMLSGTTNPVNERALEADFKNSYPGADWNIDADQWKLGGLMVGGMATFPATDRFAFDVRLLVGVLNSTSPEIRATASSGLLSASGKREEKSTTTGAVDLGFVFRYRIVSSLCLMGNVDFISANPKFDNVTTTTTFGSSTANFDQSYNTLNLTLGLGFLLN